LEVRLYVRFVRELPRQEHVRVERGLDFDAFDAAEKSSLVAADSNHVYTETGHQ
jgi:hypothetical protein